MSYSYDAESLREAIRSSSTTAGGIDMAQGTSATYGFTSRSLPSQDAVRASNRSARRDGNGSTASAARATSSRGETTTYYDSTYRISTPVTPSPPRPATARGSTTQGMSSSAGAAGRSATNPATYIICDCGNILKCRTAGLAARHPGRKYYKCFGCGEFKWNSDRSIIVYTANTVPPKCRCGKAAVGRSVTDEKNENLGRKFWACARYGTNGYCGSFDWKDTDEEWERTKLSRDLSGRKRSASNLSSTDGTTTTPGFVDFMPDWDQKNVLREMLKFGFDPTEKRSFWFKNDTDDQESQDEQSQEEQSQDEQSDGETFGHFELQHAWHICNPQREERYKLALERERRKCNRYDNIVTPNIKPELANLMNRLGNDRLDKTVNEVYLFHGTDPKDIHSILFDGLDPTVAATGFFGKGTYFAECAAKADAYAVEDPTLVTTPQHSLYPLHHRLYRQFGNANTTGVGARDHPQHIYYMLVCKVILGRPVRTNNGYTQLLHNNIGGSNDSNDDDQLVNGPDLFFDQITRSQLKQFADSDNHNDTNNNDDDDDSNNNNNNWKIPGSVIAEIGGKAKSKFREFVIFNGDQIFPEYLIAYTRNNRST